VVQDRPPTSHERISGQPWDASYRNGPAPWDIGRPQATVARLVAEGAFVGPVLDAGCGLGENAMLIASSLGLPVLGFDVAESALAIARTNAQERGIDAEFVMADALHLERLGRRFRTVLDSGLFHAFDNDEQATYAANLASVIEPGGTLHLLCFSDEGIEPTPHPVSRTQIHASFSASAGWSVNTIEPDRIETRFHEGGAPAWLATITRQSRVQA
jgi:ubiquinone/menaquinone biosynthesis C-methylase UbiE